MGGWINVSLCLGAAACVGAPELDEVTQDVNQCPAAICGFNSPEIDRNGFHDLHIYGVPNDEGFSIVRFEQRGQGYQIRVTDRRIYGAVPTRPITRLGLAGATIYL